jgi:hypothetical protein
MRLKPQAVEPQGGLEDLYEGVNGSLYFHKGLGWQALQFGRIYGGSCSWWVSFSCFNTGWDCGSLGA